MERRREGARESASHWRGRRSGEGRDGLGGGRGGGVEAMSSREAQNIISLEDGWSNNIKPKAIDVLEDHLNRVSAWLGVLKRNEEFFLCVCCVCVLCVFILLTACLPWLVI